MGAGENVQGAKMEASGVVRKVFAATDPDMNMGVKNSRT